MSPTPPTAGSRLAAALLLALLAAPAPPPLAAQLRPLDPPAWAVFDPGVSLDARAGAGLLNHQRASLAGTVGRLIEAGNVQLTWRSGRFALELGGTARRLFHDHERFAEPTGGASRADPRRSDAGAFQAATLIRLTPEGRDGLAVLRFGTRLPTTNNEVGLDRDRTDFFALLGARLDRGALRLAGEAGLGIHGTHHPDYEQADPFLYSLTGEYRIGPLTPLAALTGQRSGFAGWVQRGNESLSELRLGARAGRRLWVQALWVVGLAEFSPRGGLLLTAGTTR